jgi:hypothetical protein
MGKSMSFDSVETFVKELKARIDLFNSSTISSNIDNNRKSYEEIIYIISSYTDTPIEKLKISDLKDISLVDIKKILKLIGASDDLINELVSSIKNDTNSKKIYEIIKNKIVDYCTNYISINNTQNSIISKNIEEYQKYIDMLESKQFTEVFTDIDGLMKLMQSVNLPESDRAQILKVIASRNVNAPINQDILLVSSQNIVNKYLEDTNSKTYEAVAKYLKRNTIDLDNIDEIVKDISESNNLPLIDVNNTLISMILNNEINYYYIAETDYYNSTQDINELNDTKDTISYLNKKIMSVGNEYILEAKSILESNCESYINSINEGYTNFEEYSELTESELTSIYGSKELANDLKKMVIIREISNTLDTLDNVIVDTEKYNQCISLLNELIDLYEQYNEINKGYKKNN